MKETIIVTCGILAVVSITVLLCLHITDKIAEGHHSITCYSGNSIFYETHNAKAIERTDMNAFIVKNKNSTQDLITGNCIMRQGVAQ